jgi:hypothetical protein
MSNSDCSWCKLEDGTLRVLPEGVAIHLCARHSALSRRLHSSGYVRRHWAQAIMTEIEKDTRVGDE